MDKFVCWTLPWFLVTYPACVCHSWAQAHVSICVAYRCEDCRCPGFAQIVRFMHQVCLHPFPLDIQTSASLFNTILPPFTQWTRQLAGPLPLPMHLKRYCYCVKLNKEGSCHYCFKGRFVEFCQVGLVTWVFFGIRRFPKGETSNGWFSTKLLKDIWEVGAVK